MKRVITSLFVAFITLSALAQDRKLTVAEAVFHAVQDPSSEMGYRLLSPETLDNLQWIEGTDLYLYSKGDTYEIFNPKGEKVGAIGSELTMGFEWLQSYLRNSGSLPPITYIGKEEMVLKVDNTYYRYNYERKNVLSSITLLA